MYSPPDILVFVAKEAEASSVQDTSMAPSESIASVMPSSVLDTSMLLSVESSAFPEESLGLLYFHMYNISINCVCPCFDRFCNTIYC